MARRTLAALALSLSAALPVALSACPGPDESEADAGRSRDVKTGLDVYVELPEEDAGEPPDAASETPDAGERPDAESQPGPDAGAPDASQPQPRMWGNLQWPPFGSAPPAGKLKIYGQVWVEGVTDGAGPTSSVEAQVGVGPAGVAPDDARWKWEPASFNEDKGSNYEFMGDLTAPASGLLDYAIRYRYQSGPWLVGDRNDGGRVGSTDGFQSENAGKLAVREAGGALRLATQNLHCLHDDPKARLDAIAARLAQLNVDAVALQEVCRDASILGTPHDDSAKYLAARLTALTGRSWGQKFVQTHLANDVTPEGLGLLYALPLIDSTVKDLQATGDFPRKALLGVLGTPVGMVAMVATHLTYKQDAGAQREAQAREILAFVQPWLTYAGTGLVVAGDFNCSPGTDAHKVFTAEASPPLRDAFAEKNPGLPGLTFPASAPTARIDYVMFLPSTGVTMNVAESQVEFAAPYSGTSWVSDHRGVSARLVTP